MADNSDAKDHGERLGHLWRSPHPAGFVRVYVHFRRSVTEPFNLHNSGFQSQRTLHVPIFLIRSDQAKPSRTNTKAKPSPLENNDL